MVLVAVHAASVKREQAVDVAIGKLKVPADLTKTKRNKWWKARRAEKTLQLLHVELQQHNCNHPYEYCNEAVAMLTKLSLVAKMKSEYGFDWNETGVSCWGCEQWKVNGVSALQKHILLGK